MNEYTAVSEYFSRNEHEGVTIVSEDINGPFHVNVDQEIGFTPKQMEVEAYNVQILEHEILGPTHAYFKVEAHEPRG